MKEGKVILAALVIFAAGVITGGLTVRIKLQDVPQSAVAPTTGLNRQRAELLDRMQRQLYLTPSQRERVEKVLRESHDRMKLLWDSIAPQAQDERRRVNESIRAELTPAQQKQFEEMMKSRPANRGLDDRRRRDDRRENKPARKPESTARASNAPAASPPQ